MSQSDLKLHVRQVVSEVKNKISTSKDPQQLCQQLHRIKCLLHEAQQTSDPHQPGLRNDSSRLNDPSTKLKPITTGLTSLPNDFSDSELVTAREEFCSNHYVRFLECLVDLLSLDWCGKFDVNQRREYLDVFFLRGVPQDAFLVLSSAAIQSR